MSDYKKENNLKIREFLNYLKFEKGNAENTIKSYERDLKFFAREMDRDFNFITEDDLINYVDKMNSMSFSRFICPENKEDILNEMERSFKSTRSARVSKCK